MPYICIRLVSNPQTVVLNFSATKASNVAIHSYQFTGLVGAPGPIFLEVRNQPMTSLVSNVSSCQFPLGNATGSTVFEEFSNPIKITEGDNKWNDGRSLELILTDFNGNPITLANGYILFEYIPVEARDEKPGISWVPPKEFTEWASKNMSSLPSVYGNSNTPSWFKS